MKAQTERERLLEEVHRSRSELQGGLSDTRKAVDFSSRIEASMKKNLLWWIGGSLAAGIVIASATGRSSEDQEAGGKNRKTGISSNAFFKSLLKLGGLLLSFSGPLLKTFLTREILEILTNRDRADN
ncbi:MAG: hypothetical protein P1U87_00560 [Verrucomicrobiales bacterium]|nr:hypothetical protein [Verrucomicrobiales bacterium]